MEIKLKCSCGARAVFRDVIYINHNGIVDEKGRLFLIEVRSDEWQERHRMCQVVHVEKVSPETAFYTEPEKRVGGGIYGNM